MKPTTHHFAAADGTRLVWHELGKGRPLLLLHGLFSSAETNWLRFGTARRLAEAGLRCLMLDFRAHGDSEAPADPAAYPPDILTSDVADWVAHLALDDFDLAGFSLGGRTAVHAVIGGVTPRRLAICGMGLKGIVDQAEGTRWFIDTIARRDEHAKGSDDYFAVQFMRANGVDPDAATLLLQAQTNARAKDVAAIDVPTLVLCADEDRYRAEAELLARTIPNARFAGMPGTHMSCVTKPEFGAALADFFAA